MNLKMALMSHLMNLEMQLPINFIHITQSSETTLMSQTESRILVTIISPSMVTSQRFFAPSAVASKNFHPRERLATKFYSST